MKQMIYIQISEEDLFLKNHSKLISPSMALEYMIFHQWLSSFFWFSVFQIKEFFLSPPSVRRFKPRASMFNQNVPLIGGVNLMGLSFITFLFWLSLQWIIAHNLEVRMVHFCMSKPGRAFHKLLSSLTEWCWTYLIKHRNIDALFDIYSSC